MFNEATSVGATFSTIQIGSKFYRLAKLTAYNSQLDFLKAGKVEVLLIGSGGTGGTGGSRGGGGGGGWYRQATIDVTATSYPIEVGVANSLGASTAGNPSKAFGLTAEGGGAGAPSALAAPAGANGGGGGGSGGPAVPNLAGGVGNPGFNGGRGFGGGITQRASGGGAGSGGHGQDGTLATGGIAGLGLLSDFDGMSKRYAPGGRGSGPTLPAQPEGFDGPGAGGQGGSDSFGPAQNGIVMVRYEITEPIFSPELDKVSYWDVTENGIKYRGMTISKSVAISVLKPRGLQVLMVAGGGAAAKYANANTGGAGAGGLIQATHEATVGSFVAVVGLGGTQSDTNTDYPQTGGDTTIFGLTAFGGGRGGGPRTIQLGIGGNGGSGGGTVQGRAATGGQGVEGQGHDGGVGPVNNPGAGGGAGGPGVPYTPGVGLTINFDGTSRMYAIGGQSGGAGAHPQWGTPGCGANGGMTNGNTGFTPGSGKDGIIMLRWVDVTEITKIVGSIAGKNVLAGTSKAKLKTQGKVAGKLALFGSIRGRTLLKGKLAGKGITVAGNLIAQAKLKARLPWKVGINDVGTTAVKTAGELTSNLTLTSRGQGKGKIVGSLSEAIVLTGKIRTKPTIKTSLKGQVALASKVDSVISMGARLIAFIQLVSYGLGIVRRPPIKQRGRVATAAQSKVKTAGNRVITTRKL